MKYLEKIYLEGISSLEVNKRPEDSRYQCLIEEQQDICNQLIDTMDEEQLLLFDQLKDKREASLELELAAVFSSGFKIGAKILKELSEK